MSDFYPHFGLTFSAQQLEEARQHTDEPDLQTAWQRLTQDDPADSWQTVLLDGLRYRLLDDETAGKRAASRLQQVTPPAGGPLLDALRLALTITHISELVRDLIPPATRRNWQQSFAAQVRLLCDTATHDSVVRLWQMTLMTAAGVAFDDPDSFEAGIDHFKRTIRDDVHPDGYVHSAVKASSDDTFLRQVQAAGALVLTAEIATHAGTDLWHYEHRGVTALTAATYLLYFYFYPEKWQWTDDLTREQTTQIIREHGAFMEIASYRGYIRDVHLLLEEQRPMLAVSGGGITTLTHYALREKKRRGLFGF